MLHYLVPVAMSHCMGRMNQAFARRTLWMVRPSWVEPSERCVSDSCAPLSGHWVTAKPRPISSTFDAVFRKHSGESLDFSHSTLKLPNRQQDRLSAFVAHNPHGSAIHRDEILAIILPLDRLEIVLSPVLLNSSLQLPPNRLRTSGNSLDTRPCRVSLETLLESLPTVLCHQDFADHRSSRHVSPW